MKKQLIAAFAALLCLALCTAPVLADASKVVTMGADLTPEQKQTMWDYFKTSEKDVVYEEINNAEEHQYLDGIAPQEQIGSRTYSCAYIEPTNSGGINVKTANLNWVTADMIRSALTTAGVQNADVVAASPFPVSGTGALTGILKAYQKATNTPISEDKKEAANQELVTTTGIADSLTSQGTDSDQARNEATEVVNEAKKELLEDKKNGPVSDEQLQRIVDTVGAKLTDSDRAALLALLQKINTIDYSDKELKGALENINTTLDKLVNGVSEQNNIFEKMWATLQSWFGAGSITDKTDDAALGAGAVVTDTANTLDTTVKENGPTWWDNFTTWLQGIFSPKPDQSETDSTQAPEQTPSPDSSAKPSQTPDTFTPGEVLDVPAQTNPADTPQDSTGETPAAEDTQNAAGDHDDQIQTLPDAVPVPE